MDSMPEAVTLPPLARTQQLFRPPLSASSTSENGISEDDRPYDFGIMFLGSGCSV